MYQEHKGEKSKLSNKYEAGKILLEAIRNNQPIEVVRALIEAGACLFVRDKDGKNTCFELAVSKKNWDLAIEILKMRKIRGNDYSIVGGQALLEAIRDGQSIEVVRALIEAGASLTVRDKDGKNTCVELAVSKKNWALAIEILETRKIRRDNNSIVGGQALLEAIRDGQPIEIVRALIKAEASLAVTDKDRKNTCVELAVSKKNWDLAIELLETRKIRGDNNSIVGGQALLEAIRDGQRIEIVRALIKAGASLTVTDKDRKNTCFELAVSKKNWDLAIEILKTRKIRGDNNSIASGQALLEAIRDGQPIEIVRALIKAGASLTVIDKDGKNTCFELAVSKKNWNCVIEILKAKKERGEAYRNAASQALSEAIRDYQPIEIIRLLKDLNPTTHTLMKTGGKISQSCLTNKDILESLEKKLQASSTHLRELPLKERKEIIEYTNQWGETLLHRMVKKGNLEAVEKLLDGGANPFIKGKNKHSAFDLTKIYSGQNQTTGQAMKNRMIRHSNVAHEFSTASSCNNHEKIEKMLGEMSIPEEVLHNALCIAIESGHGNLKTIQLLINHGASPYLNNLDYHKDKYENALSRAIYLKDKRKIDALLACPSEGITGQQIGRAIYWAIKNNDYDLTKCLCDKAKIAGVIVAALNGNSPTLDVAVQNNNTKICTLLIQYGAVLNQKLKAKPNVGRDARLADSPDSLVIEDLVQLGQMYLQKHGHKSGLFSLHANRPVAEKLMYSSQLDFRLGVEKRAPGVYTLVQEDASDEDNNAENSSAKSIDKNLINSLSSAKQRWLFLAESYSQLKNNNGELASKIRHLFDIAFSTHASLSKDILRSDVRTVADSLRERVLSYYPNVSGQLQSESMLEYPSIPAYIPDPYQQPLSYLPLPFAPSLDSSELEPLVPVYVDRKDLFKATDANASSQQPPASFKDQCKKWINESILGHLIQDWKKWRERKRERSTNKKEVAQPQPSTSQRPIPELVPVYIPPKAVTDKVPPSPISQQPLVPVYIPVTDKIPQPSTSKWPRVPVSPPANSFLQGEICQTSAIAGMFPKVPRENLSHEIEYPEVSFPPQMIFS
jgi:ankyrin repeat protein